MKNKDAKSYKLQLLTKSSLSSLKGGKEEEEYITIYINGVPYKIKVDKNGNQISPPLEIL